MTKTPHVSVIMPVYNGMPFLPKAVESILTQSIPDFEFIAVDDGSTDGSYDYLQSLTDSRMVIIRLLENKGITAALQEGVYKSKGMYIARLDSDDIALSGRLQKQLAFMQAHPEVGLLGSSFYTIDEKDVIVSLREQQLNDVEIRWRMLFKNPFFHSSVMFRKEVIEKNRLNYTLAHGEDYDLWTKIMEHANGFILRDALIRYRVNQKSWTYSKATEQADAAVSIAIDQMKKYVNEDESSLKDLIFWVRGKSATSINSSQMKSLYLKLVQAFIQRHFNQISTQFVMNSLVVLKNRLGFKSLLSFDLFSLYAIFLRIKLSRVK